MTLPYNIKKFTKELQLPEGSTNVRLSMTLCRQIYPFDVILIGYICILANRIGSE